MLENRSFDCMLGRLYPQDPDYRGLTLDESNQYGNRAYGVWNDGGMSAMTACLPDPDPGETFADMNMQLFGTVKRPATAPTMSGFAQNYATQRSKGVFAPSAVMHYFTPEQVPVISTLAKAFGVCDHWHASAPCQTWPNRFFAHTGTSLGHVDNHTFRIPFEAPSLFRRLENHQKPWRVYFHDMPQSLLLKDIWDCAPAHYRLFSQFLADAHSGSLPNYSFIEPRYFTDLFKSCSPNDEHPPHHVVYGEQLIASVYNAVRSSPCWKRTLLIVTYDEHGGCYDHVAPPAAVSPDGIVANDDQFAFDAYGVRVPAVIISPYIPPGCKIRPPTLADKSVPPFDHTSIVKTVRELFSLGAAFTARDHAAPSLSSALTLAVPNNDGPPRIDTTPPQPPILLLKNRAAATPNGMQSSLAIAAANLPSRAPTPTTVIPASQTPEHANFASVATAQAAAMVRTKLFLGL
jgi:phospholipase C